MTSAPASWNIIGRVNALDSVESTADNTFLLSVWTNWAIIWKVFLTNFLTRVAQISGDVLGHFEKHYY